MREKIIIVGGGGHAKVLISIINKSNTYDVVGYIDLEDKGKILNANYIGNDDLLNEIFLSGIRNAAIGVGQINLTLIRHNLSEKLKSIGYNFPIIVSTDAVVNEQVHIEEGVQIFDGAIINSGTFIGKHTIINTNAVVEHDCKVGNFCHIAPSVSLSGGVEIGDFSMIGIGSTIIQGVKIASNIMVGANSLVTKDLTIPGIYIGSPVKKIS